RARAAADALTGPANERRRRMRDDVRAPLDRPAEVWRREGRIDHEGRAVRVGDRRDALEIEHVAARIADRFTVEKLRVRTERGVPPVEVVRIDEGDLEAELALQVLELRDRAAVERGGGHDVIARHEHGEQRGRLSREAARE